MIIHLRPDRLKKGWADVSEHSSPKRSIILFGLGPL